MKGKRQFTQSEASRIRSLITQKLGAHKTEQKGIRDKIRAIGFYYTDFSSSKHGYTVEDFDSLIAQKLISIIGLSSAEVPPTIISTPINSPKIFPIPINIDYNNIESIKNSGFEGFAKIGDIQHDMSKIPNDKGIYLIIWSNSAKPKFVVQGTGGYFKSKNPNVLLAELENNWVDNTQVIYIGKAGGEGVKSTLKSRINEYLKFGQGKAIGHQGGRFIWQIENNQDLIVCWKTLKDDEPSDMEKDLIKDFIAQYGKLPFANLKIG